MDQVDRQVISSRKEIYFIDEFLIPKDSFDRFKERLDFNTNFIKQLDGLIKDEVLVEKDSVSEIL